MIRKVVTGMVAVAVLAYGCFSRPLSYFKGRPMVGALSSSHWPRRRLVEG